MTSTDPSAQAPEPATVDLKLEVVTLPVSDVDRAKRFYQNMGWRLDADIAVGENFRVVQFTPPHSADVPVNVRAEPCGAGGAADAGSAGHGAGRTGCPGSG
jgi:catechol 2,3-dioxygenase-like lactoylglutathione lyase family enzyme